MRRTWGKITSVIDDDDGELGSNASDESQATAESSEYNGAQPRPSNCFVSSHKSLELKKRQLYFGQERIIQTFRFLDLGTICI